MTKQQAQEIIDQAIDPLIANRCSPGYTAYALLQLLRNRPELLVVIDEVDALIASVDSLESVSKEMHDALKPFTTESLEMDEATAKNYHDRYGYPKGES